MPGLPSVYGPQIYGRTALVGTGTTQADATLLKAQSNTFSTVASGTGCMLPYAGEITVVNNGSSALNLYPSPGDQIDTNGVNAPISVLPGSSWTGSCAWEPAQPAPRVWNTIAQNGSGGGSLTLAQLTALLLTAPTTLPATAGVLWLDGGVPAIS